MATASVLYFHKNIAQLECRKCKASVDAPCNCCVGYDLVEKIVAQHERKRQYDRDRKQSQKKLVVRPDIEIIEEKEIRAAEAKLSTARMQSLMFDSVCRLLAEMTPHTRARVKRHMEENYGSE